MSIMDKHMYNTTHSRSSVSNQNTHHLLMPILVIIRIIGAYLCILVGSILTRTLSQYRAVVDRDIKIWDKFMAGAKKCTDFGVAASLLFWLFEQLKPDIFEADWTNSRAENFAMDCKNCATATEVVTHMHTCILLLCILLLNLTSSSPLLHSSLSFFFFFANL